MAPVGTVPGKTLRNASQGRSQQDSSSKSKCGQLLLRRGGLAKPGEVPTLGLLGLLGPVCKGFSSQMFFH